MLIAIKKIVFCLDQTSSSSIKKKAKGGNTVSRFMKSWSQTDPSLNIPPTTNRVFYTYKGCNSIV